MRATTAAAPLRSGPAARAQGSLAGRAHSQKRVTRGPRGFAARTSRLKVGPRRTDLAARSRRTNVFEQPEPFGSREAGRQIK